MKIFLVIFAFSVFTSIPEWNTDFGKAQKEAGNNNKLILLSFSGSDWCGPCIRMKKEIFGSDAFNNYASEYLVLVRADFPRQKKNIPDKEQVLRNEALADKYNPQGKFPFTLLLDASGKILKEWDGLPKLTPEQFVDEIKSVQHAGK
jgi:thioredoxin-related protein